jgi:hypothetical protein
MSWAFSDESERAERVLFGLTLVPTGVVKDARRTLRGLLLPGQRRLHMSKESPRRRREVLKALADIEMGTTILELRRPVGTSRVNARSLLLVAGAEIVADLGVSIWVFDSQDDAQLHRDRQILGGLGVTAVYDHRANHEEPLLWAVDSLLWAYGAGGDCVDGSIR